MKTDSLIARLKEWPRREVVVTLPDGGEHEITGVVAKVENARIVRVEVEAR